MSTLTDVFECSTDAMFGIDTAGSIRYANSAFERLLGHARHQLRGKWCARVLCGSDMHGRPFCGRNCPVPKTAAAQPAIDDFDLMVRHADGGHLLVNIGASYIPPELREQAGEVAVLFGLRQVHPQRLLRRMATAPRETADRSAAGRRYRLTSREREVLRLAASGMKTGQIAGRLSVSTQTVRTHFKNIYPKLGVNSRIEAVIYAMRHDIH